MCEGEATLAGHCKIDEIKNYLMMQKCLVVMVIKYYENLNKVPKDLVLNLTFSFPAMELRWKMSLHRGITSYFCSVPKM